MGGKWGTPSGDSEDLAPSYILPAHESWDSAPLPYRSHIWRRADCPDTKLLSGPGLKLFKCPHHLSFGLGSSSLNTIK